MIAPKRSQGRWHRGLVATPRARERVGHVWLLDPVDKLLEVFRLEGQGWLLLSAHEGTEKVRAPPFEAAELDLARFWLEGG